MPEKAPAHMQNEPLKTKALRSTKNKFIYKEEAQKVPGNQRNSKLGQEEEKHQIERQRNTMKSFSVLIVSRKIWGGRNAYRIQVYQLEENINVKNIYNIYYPKYNVARKLQRQMLKKKKETSNHFRNPISIMERESDPRSHNGKRCSDPSQGQESET